MIEGRQLPTIDARRVRLRWLTDADVDALFAIFSDPVMMRFWATPPMKERAEAEDYLRRIHEGFAGKTLFQWGVERKEDARVIGSFTLFRLDAGNARAEIGYALGSAYWKMGYMSEALPAGIGFAFNTLKLRRLEADVDPRNDNSLRILAKLGFRQEGLLRERWNVGGEIQDTALFGLLAREWQGPAPA
ncbi:MAG: GNAT family N-acetyltransferase [Steroidobacteraceae bacterium]|nr:GNAT family N-acetyltransferase [Steroidobacteraceae bacterium]